MLDPEFMEPDSYFIFAKIMDSIQSFYHIRDMRPTASGHFPTQTTTAAPTTTTTATTQSISPPQNSAVGSRLEVVGQLNHIRDRILARVDPVLHRHLLDLDIPLTLFGM